MLGTMMIPGAVTLIPGFVLMTQIGWVSTYWALAVPGIVEAFGIFLMTQFLKSVPVDLEEAARIDGASQFQTVWTVIMPLARPALITLAILAFQSSWNEYMGPLLYLTGAPNFTLPVGLRFFQSQFRADWNFTLIGSMFNAIPVLIIFFIFNRYFIEGVSYSGIKG
ncbi:MAG: carbohydrate ABC transporter permease [Anaerolineae bacterium]|nr:carbohydrate ABC transporter permease [Anaerolineae bacterium]